MTVDHDLPSRLGSVLRMKIKAYNLTFTDHDTVRSPKVFKVVNTTDSILIYTAKATTPDVSRLSSFQM